MVSTIWKTNSINVKKVAQLIEAIKTILNLLFLKKKISRVQKHSQAKLN